MDANFLISICILLGAAIVTVPLFQRLGLGSVIGYLAAGLLIGPYGLKWIPSAEEMLHFSELGVVMFLFLVGLEVHPARVWELRTRIFGTGAAQVISVTCAICAVALLWGPPIKAAWVIGMGLSLSSTAIGLQVLKEKGLLHSNGGQTSFAVLLFQDIAVIPMMAIIPFLGVTEEHAASGSMAAGLGKSVLAIVGVILGGRYATRPLFRYIAKTNLREIFTGFSLLLVLGIAYLMHAVGLSMALGTFLAGVLLANSEYRHELEIDIEPFKGLLLGLFFISVGMTIDSHQFLQNPAPIFVMSFTVIAVKVLMLYGIGKIFKLSNKDSTVFSLALSQGGEFAFVIFALAVGIKILPPEMANNMNLVVAFTMVTTPILFKIYEFVGVRTQPTERQPDSIDDNRNQVIVAGYGRFGQIVTRILQTKGFTTTVLDYDSAQVDLVRKFGSQAFYGDATRLDLLEAAGAKQAKLIVVAVDSFEASQKIVEIAEQHFPKAKLLVRVRNRPDAYFFLNKKVEVFRETFGSALEMGEASLKSLGFTAHEAHRAVLQFARHDVRNMHTAAPHHNDERTLISLSKTSREELEKLMKQDQNRDHTHQDGWSST